MCDSHQARTWQPLSWCSWRQRRRTLRGRSQTTTRLRPGGGRCAEPTASDSSSGARPPLHHQQHGLTELRLSVPTHPEYSCKKQRLSELTSLCQLRFWVRSYTSVVSAAACFRLTALLIARGLKSRCPNRNLRFAPQSKASNGTEMDLDEQKKKKENASAVQPSCTAGGYRTDKEAKPANRLAGERVMRLRPTPQWGPSSPEPDEH